MKIVKFNLDKSNPYNVNLGPVVRGSQAVFLGLKWDPECRDWDLVSHRGFEEGEFLECKFLNPTFFEGSANGAYLEFTDPTSTGLVLVKGKKQVVCFELTEQGTIASYGERFY